MQFAWMLPSVLFGAYLGVSSGAWHLFAMSLASGLIWLIARRVNDSREVDLTDRVSFDGKDVWIGDYQLPRYEIFWKKKWHPVVYAAYLAKHSPPQFSLLLGLESESGHALIIGPTGSGKSELLKLLLAQTTKTYPGCELTLIDFKGGATFGKFKGLPQVKSMATDIDQHDPQFFWQNLRAEIGRREQELANRGVSRIEELNLWSVQMPRHYIFIDELVAALAESAHAAVALTEVASRGRSLGIHLVAATQSTQGVPRALLTNLRARIALAEPDPIELAQLNMKRPVGPAQTPDGWLSGILQKPGELSSYFYFPLGASFGN